MNNLQKYANTLYGPGTVKVCKMLAEHLLTPATGTDTFVAEPPRGTGEVEKITSAIHDARRQGVTEFDMTISSELASRAGVDGSLMVQGLPVNVGCKVEKESEGKFLLRVTFGDKGVAEEIREMHELKQAGIITDEEFAQSKAQLLAKR